MNSFFRVTVLMMTLTLGAVCGATAQAEDAGYLLLTPADLTWVDGPPSIPPGAKMVLIEGDLKKPVPFTFRLKLPAGYQVAAHTHTAIEHVTVISGTFFMGPGEKPDPAKAVALTAGSFALFRPGHCMFAWTKEETVVQVHGVGPWEIKYTNPADDPRKK